MKPNLKNFFLATSAMMFIFSLTGYAHGMHGRNDKSAIHDEISMPSTTSADFASVDLSVSEYSEVSLEAQLLKASLKVYPKSSFLQFDFEPDHQAIKCCVGSGCACCLASNCNVLSPNPPQNHYTHGVCGGNGPDCYAHPNIGCGQCP
ncbi:MAG: hypothetical protein JST84_01700 [Acidobacteria bacterium]|nr:hypothetical protein [Acidobacteriota bacterium]